MLGELQINLLTRLFLDKKIYHLIKNVTIPAGQGTTQIDHILVSRYGVFVVETKNMSGWIFGGENQKSWTQKHYKHSTTFQNPLRQNYKHTLALAELIGLDSKKIISVIVFIGKSTFKTPMPENVTQGMDYIHFIKRKQTAILGEFEVGELINRIKERCLVQGRKTHRQHVDHLNDLHSVSRHNRGNSLNRDIFTQLLIGLIGAALAAALVFAIIQPGMVKEIPDRFITILEKYSSGSRNQQNDGEVSPSKPGKNNSISQDYSFSEDQVKKAMEEVLREKAEPPLTVEDAEIDPAESAYQFEIELHSGVKIYTDNAEFSEDAVRYSSKSGLLITLDRDEIKTMKKKLKK